MGFVTETLSGPWAGAESDWRPGLTRRMAPIACCPQCGSTDTRHRGVREPGATLVRWDCVACGNAWKSAADRKAGRANLLR